MHFNLFANNMQLNVCKFYIQFALKYIFLIILFPQWVYLFLEVG